MPGRSFVANQIFVGLPWRNVRGHYERIIPALEKKYPLFLTIVGWEDSQHATDLFEVIKGRIKESSWGIFDATGGNANVSLEYGYAEGVELPKVIFLSTHGASRRTPGNPIISDLAGVKRVQYKTHRGLELELHKFCKKHSYTIRFEKTLRTALERKSTGGKRSFRVLALKIIRKFDGAQEIRRDQLLQDLCSDGWKNYAIEFLLKRFQMAGLIKCSKGAQLKVSIT